MRMALQQMHFVTTFRWVNRLHASAVSASMKQSHNARSWLASFFKKWQRLMCRESQLHFLEHDICGMLGCLDCMHVAWKNCPVALQGAFTGKEGMLTLVLEAVPDYHLWIWHAAFGFAGVLNDLNIWENSSLLQAMLDGTILSFGLGAGYSKNCFSGGWHLSWDSQVCENSLSSYRACTKKIFCLARGYLEKYRMCIWSDAMEIPNSLSSIWEVG